MARRVAKVMSFWNTAIREEVYDYTETRECGFHRPEDCSVILRDSWMFYYNASKEKLSIIDRDGLEETVAVAESMQLGLNLAENTIDVTLIYRIV